MDEVSTLVKSGVHVDCRDDQGMSSLHLAAASGHTQVVTVLLDHVASPNLVDNVRAPPLPPCA